MATQAHGHTGTGLHRHRATQVRGHTGMRLHRHMATQVRGHTGMGPHRHGATQVQGYIIKRQMKLCMYCTYVRTYEQGLVKFNTLHTLELVKHVYTNLHTYIRTYLYTVKPV